MACKHRSNRVTCRCWCGRTLSLLAAGAFSSIPALGATPAIGPARPAASLPSGSGAAPAAAHPAATAPTSLPPIKVVGYVDPYKVLRTRSATRTDTPLIDIPLTLQPIPIQLLDDQAANSLADAVRNAPGVSVNLGEGNRDQFVIRGVSTKADFFVDGVRDDSEYFRDLYNVREVDILQGPAALLFGRGNAGGLVNLVTREPERATIRNVAVHGGDFGFLRGTLDLGAPIGESAAFRLDAVAQRNGGDANFRDHYFEHRHGIDPEFRFWPNDATTLEVGASQLQERLRADRGIPSQHGRPAAVARGAFFGSVTQNSARTHVTEAHARIEHVVGPDTTLRDTFRVSRNEKSYQNMYPGGPVAPDGTLSIAGYRHGNARTSWFNHADMVIEAATGPLHHKLLLGVDLGHQDDADHKENAITLREVPVTDPLVTGTFDLPDRDNGAQADSQNLYVEDQMRWGEHWIALAGIGWDRFSVRAQYHLLPAGNDTRHVDTAFTPRFGIIYKPVPNDSMYASVSQGFMPQGSNLALSLKSPKGANLDAQAATNHEIGNKLDLFDGRLALTAALFQLDLEHVVSPAPDDPTVLVQTGSQRNRGLELAASGNLTRRWSIAVNYAYLDARIMNATTDGPAGALAGLVPYNQFSLWTRYDINQHWGVGAGVLGRSRAFTSFSNAVVLPGYARADAMAYYRHGPYRIQLNVRNLFDRHYFATASGDNQIMPGEPREITLNVSADY